MLQKWCAFRTGCQPFAASFGLASFHGAICLRVKFCTREIITWTNEPVAPGFRKYIPQYTDVFDIYEKLLWLKLSNHIPSYMVLWVTVTCTQVPRQPFEFSFYSVCCLAGFPSHCLFETVYSYFSVEGLPSHFVVGLYCRFFFDLTFLHTNQWNGRPPFSDVTAFLFTGKTIVSNVISFSFFICAYGMVRCHCFVVHLDGKLSLYLLQNVPHNKGLAKHF